jgi:hypothetical protein
MEDILELYAESYHPDYPWVCFDEMPVQLIAETRLPVACQPGRVQRIDYEYERHGTANLFCFFQPLVGWRQVKVTAQRTKVDFAQCMKQLVDEFYPDAKKIRIVLDNLNTHTPASLYQAFEPAEARRILRKLEFHYTPKHASWLNMVEIEFSVLFGQCLDRRIPDVETLTAEIAAWQQQRNDDAATVNWQFNNTNARSKFKRLYPS